MSDEFCTNEQAHNNRHGYGEKGLSVPADQVQQGACQFVPEARLDESENAKLNGGDTRDIELMRGTTHTTQNHLPV